MIAKRNFLLIAAWLFAGFSFAADLTLREQVLPAGAVVRLGDVADVTAANPGEATRLEALPLMPAPAPGTATMVTAQGIKELVVASGVDLNELRFFGAIRVVIGKVESKEERQPAKKTFVDPSDVAATATKPTPKRSTGFRVKPQPARSAAAVLNRNTIDALTTDLQARIAEYARLQTGEAMVEALTEAIDPRRLRLLSQATSQVSVAATERVVVGRQRFLVSFDTAGGAVRFPVFADIRPATPAVFVFRSVPRGALLTRADVEIRRLPIDVRLRADESPLRSIDDAVGQEAATALRPGALLTDANCLPPLMVSRGDEVTVVSGGGGIRIRMVAKARANGRLGEIVPVETLEIRERLSARVTGRRELAVLSATSGAGDYAAALNTTTRIR